MTQNQRRKAQQRTQVAELRAAQHHFRRIDPVLSQVVATIGAVRLPDKRVNFDAFADIITSQQLNPKAADAVLERLRTAAGRPLNAARVLTLGEAGLRGCGLSGAKAQALLSIARRCGEQPGFLRRLGQLSPEETVVTLTAQRGLGAWSAYSFLLFHRRHPDIFAHGDAALHGAISALYGIAPRGADGGPAAALIQSWSPHRSTACLYLWAWWGRRKKES